MAYFSQFIFNLIRVVTGSIEINHEQEKVIGNLSKNSED